MKIALKIMGQMLFARITKAMAAANSPFPRSSNQGKLIHWQLIQLESPFNSGHLESPPGELSITLMEVDDAATVENLRAIERRESLHVRSVFSFTYELSPLILVLRREITTNELLDMPDIISDWMTEPVPMDDLVRRVFAGLKRKQQLRSELGYGVLTLLPESRLLCYANDTTLLTAAEVSVAELFLNYFGTVISIEDIHLLFKLAGRSTEGSNIRVTMFQLRFKIEAVTRCRFTLINAYNTGYVLRHVQGYEPNFPSFEARQDRAVYNI